jgi:hypothetical protein
MRSIEANYTKIQNNNPTFGGYICLAQAVRGRKYSRKSLVKAFKEMMPTEEYAGDETKALVDHLEILTNRTEEGEI